MTSESLALFLLLIQVLPPGAVSNFSSSLFPSPSSPKCLCDFDFETQRWREIWKEQCFFALFAPFVLRREIFQQSLGDKRRPM